MKYELYKMLKMLVAVKHDMDTVVSEGKGNPEVYSELKARHDLIIELVYEIYKINIRPRFVRTGDARLDLIAVFDTDGNTLYQEYFEVEL